MKEYHYIRCREAGIEYKKLVRSYGEFEYGGLKLFIHKAQPAKWPYVISEVSSGLSIACGLKKPTVAAAKLYLARNLTEEQDRALDLFSQQRLLRAYRRKRLEDLPHRREVLQDILFALEETMTSGFPF
jgi:hypothetical protein